MKGSSVMEGPEPMAPVILRMKRKRMLDPIETLWLEVDARPVKRQAGMHGLTLAETQPGSSVETRPKFLFSRVQTVSSAEVLLESLEELKKERKKTGKEQREPIIRPITPGSSAQSQHDAAVRQARFQQVWSRRLGVSKAGDDDAQARELFRLYDVVRVDVEAIAAAKAARRDKAKEDAVVVDEGQWLSNYLPLLREYLPSIAAEVESAAKAPADAIVEDNVDFVYDVYTLEEDVDEEHRSAPTVVVADESFDWRESNRDSDYDSEDSNAADNPNNDYPDEEDFSHQATSGSDFEEEDPVKVFDDDSVADHLEEEEMIWRPRR